MKGRKGKLDNVVPMKGTATRAAPPAPDWLCEQSQEVWDGLAPMLIGQGRLRPEFEYQFAAYCAAVGTFIMATNDIALGGLYYETTTRYGRQQKKVAAVGIQSEAIAKMNQLSALFGLSPVDEKRLASDGQGDLFNDVLAQLKGGGGAD